MRRPTFSRLIPGLLFCVLVLFLVAGRSKLPPQLVYRFLQENPARAELILEADEARRGSGGWLKNPVVAEETGGIPPTDLSVVDLGTSIVFAQVGDGRIPGTQQFFQTTLILINQTANATNGTIEFYDNDGNPLEVSIDGVAASTFQFNLGSLQTKRFKTSGEGGVKVGWAHIHSEQPIGGTAAFGIRDATGRIYTDVGVEESPVGREFMIFADMIGDSRTGIALANPSPEPIEIQVQMFGRNGGLKVGGVINLPPWGHTAQFLDEIFPKYLTNQSFEGSLVATSDQDFSGITLRSTGSQLTSMPMLKKPAAGTAWTKIAFAHIGDGSAGDLSITSTIILMNNLAERAEGTIQFYRSTGEEMLVTAGATRASQFNFALGPRAVSRMVTSGSGDLQTGYAVVSMDQPINGTALFSIYNKGLLDTEAGVGTTPLQKNLTIVADSLERYNTGIAVAYPIPSDVAASTNVSMNLYDRQGLWKASKQITLENFQHTAQFITDLFPDVQGIDEFDGRVDISATQFAAFLSLRQADTKLTSMPYFRKKYGFAPTSSLQFAQNLATPTSPALAWRLVQNNNDFALENVRLTAPGLGLNPTGVTVGSRIGFGHFTRDEDSRTYEMVVRETGSLVFDLVEFGSDGTAIIGEGTMQGEASSGLAIDLNFYDKRPFTYLGSQVETNFWLSPGLIRAPVSPGQVEVTTEFRSVSTEIERESRLLRRTTQRLTFGAPSASLANLLRISPVFLRPGVTVHLEGTQFGENPLVLFNFEQFDTASYQTTQHAVPMIAASDPDGWTVPVPMLTSADSTRGYLQLRSIQVDNGSGPGNPYLCAMNFAPVFRVFPDTHLGGASAGLSFTFDQAERQLAMVWFQVGFFNVLSDFSGLSPGTDIGTGKSGYDEYLLKVRTVSPNEVVVDVAEEGSSEAFAEMILQRFPDAQPGEILPGLGVILRVLEPPAGPQLISSRLKLEWNLSGLPVVLPAAGNLVRVSGMAISAPNSGASPGLQVDFSTYFPTTAE